ncbi:MAG: hypothetical protein R3300_08395, partial [Candidatus Promineifilaceae bacterium]|nr:hypothetical protein [Candidatus Promineifilaceae bacterium]
MEEIAPGVFVETNYEGVNVGVVQTTVGLVCIDTPSYPRDARHWVGQLNRLHNRANRFLILTDGSGDRAINARWLNARLIVHAAAAERFQQYDKR